MFMTWLALLALLAQDAQTSSPEMTLHYPSGQVSATVAREMLDALDEEYARVRHELGCVIGKKIDTLVLPLATWEAMGHSPWAGGLFDGRIQVPLVYERSRVGPKMREVFAHEIVHACIARFGNHPTWLHEGLAQHLSGVKLSTDLRRTLKQALSAGKLPGLERVAGPWGHLSGAQASTAYAYGLLAVEEWIAAEGMEAVRQTLRNPGSLAGLMQRLNERLKQ
jgi:hypothetical protein